MDATFLVFHRIWNASCASTILGKGNTVLTGCQETQNPELSQSSTHLAYRADWHKCLPSTIRHWSGAGVTLLFCYYLKLRGKVENIPFGGSRLFSVNTQTNEIITILCWVVGCVSERRICVSASERRCTKRRDYWFFSAGRGGFVHVLHGKLFGKIAKQCVLLVVFRRCKSHVPVCIHTPDSCYYIHTYI